MPHQPFHTYVKNKGAYLHVHVHMRAVAFDHRYMNRLHSFAVLLKRLGLINFIEMSMQS